MRLIIPLQILCCKVSCDNLYYIRLRPDVHHPSSAVSGDEHQWKEWQFFLEKATVKESGVDLYTDEPCMERMLSSFECMISAQQMACMILWARFRL